MERWGDEPVQKEIEAQVEICMPRGDKSSYTGKQKRMAEHIEEGYEKRGLPEKEAERRAWATVHKETRGGNKNGSRRRGPPTNGPAEKSGPNRRPPGGEGLPNP